MKYKNVLSVQNKVIIIFGGCGLLGTEFGKHLLSEKAKICIADLSLLKFNKNYRTYIKKFKDKLFFSKVDVLNKQSIDKCIGLTKKKFKKNIDVIINASAMNAPFDKKFNKAQFSSIENYPIKLWKKSLDINLTGALLIAQLAIREFSKSKRGHLINIGSNYGLVAPDQSIYKENGKQKFYKPADYIVSKFGLIGLNKYLAAYFKKSKIRFNLLTPSGVEYKQSKNFKKKYSNKTLLNRMSHKFEYNGAIQFLCSDASSYMTGSNLIIDGGWTAT